MHYGACAVAEKRLVVANIEGHSGIRACCGQNEAEDAVAPQGTRHR